MRKEFEMTHALRSMLAGLAATTILTAALPAFAQTAPARAQVNQAQAGFTGGVRVAAGDVDGDGTDDFETEEPETTAPSATDLAAPQEQQEVGLLLPAVQKVREAANRSPEPGADDLAAPEEEGELRCSCPQCRPRARLRAEVILVREA